MRRTVSTPASRARPRWLTATSATVVAAIILIANVHAEDKAWADKNERGGLLYSMRFEGWEAEHLDVVWRGTFTNDNFVITESARRVVLPIFEIRHVRLTELAQSIAFLSQGALTVEVVEGDSPATGNLWRIGTAASGDAAALKMRAIAAPHVFADTNLVAHLLASAAKMEDEKFRLTDERLLRGLGGRGRHEEMRTRVNPLPEQKVLVLIGTENGIAGIESLIQACEQAAAESAKTLKSGK